MSAGLLACVDGTGVPWPAPPAGAESALWIRRCGETLEAHAYDLPAPSWALVERCAEESTYWLAYLERSLSAYRLRPGPLETRGCQESALPCCRSVALPASLPGQVFESKRSEGDTAFFRADEVAAGAWPAALSELRVNRDCSCPTSPPLVLNRPARGYRRVRFARLEGESLLVLGLRHRRDMMPSELAELFLTTVSKLEAEGFPREDQRFAEIAGSTPSIVVATKDGRYFVGQEAWVPTATTGVPGPLLRGRVGEAPTPVAFPDAEGRRESRLIALRPGTEDEPELAVLAATRPFEVATLRGEEWTLRGEASLMTDTCRAPFRTQEEALVWRSEDELWALPRAARPEWRQDSIDDPVDTPDGFWRIEAGRVRWERPPRPEGECWSGIYPTETWGPLLATHKPRLLRLGAQGWEAFIAPEAFPPITFEGELQSLLETSGGLLYGRATGLIGLISDGDHCFEVAATQGKLRQLVRVGDWIVGAEDASSAQTDAAMVLIAAP